MALSKIAQSIFLGNGQIWNFLDYAVNRSVSNLLTYTQTYGYLGSNLYSNFGGGGMRRIYDNEIVRDAKYAIPTEGDFTIPMTAPAGNGGNIGDIYTVPEGAEGKNSSIGFLTTSAFTVLQHHIRSLNTVKNRDIPRVITDKFTLKSGTTLAISASTGNQFMTPIRYRSANDGAATVSGGTRLTMPDDGLDGYSEQFRKKYSNAAFVGIKLPNNPTYGTYIPTYWSQRYPYGFERDESQTVEKYSINDTVNVPDKQILSSNFTGSETFIENNVTGNSRAYGYYDERETSGTSVSIENTQAMFDSTVRINSFENSSRMMRRTNDLFRKMKTDTLINRFHTKVPKDAKIDQMLSAYHPVFGLSRGRNLIREEYEDSQFGDDSSGYDNPYCRVWTAHHQYSKLKDRIRPFSDGNGGFKDLKGTQDRYGTMRTTAGLEQLNERSVLQKNGFVKISPMHDGGTYNDNIKNYMFSIENLAWKDITKDTTNTSLSNEQRGPHGGRIMWFPPYNLKFSENINVNWSENNFIGRGEGLYTYTNTVRSGTLDFTILIDHPSVVNIWRGTGEVDDKERRQRDLLRFFAGCSDLNDSIDPPQPAPPSASTPIVPIIEPKPVYYSKEVAYVIFFPNDFTGNDSDLDSVICGLTDYNRSEDYSTTERDDAYEDEILQDYNQNSYGFNPIEHEDKIREMLFGESTKDDLEIKFMDDLLSLSSNFTGELIFGMAPENCEISNIETQGFASSHGYETNNKVISDRRRKMIERILVHEANELSESNVDYTKNAGKTITVPDIDGREDVNSLEAKIARSAYAIIRITWKEDVLANSNPAESDISGSVVNHQMSDGLDLTDTATTASNIATLTQVETPTGYSYDNEYLYFATISEDNNLVHKNIVDKVKYFSPVFHSITPEGFNARLTFLHQCTRQGPTHSVSGGRVNTESDNYLKYAGNLSFGRPPYCILRIGDFFNTKIVITSISIQYGNNGGIQWDLNPEGIGVQPMYADVSINFNFIGGQDLSGPVERLQNAVTANYYANASVYSRHADNGISYFDALRGGSIGMDSAETGTTNT